MENDYGFLMAYLAKERAEERGYEEGREALYAYLAPEPLPAPSEESPPSEFRGSFEFPDPEIPF